MTPVDAPVFMERLTVLAELFDSKFSEAKLQIYFEALCDLSITEIVEGIAAAARFSKFMPKPVEIRDLAGCGLEDKAERSWIEFRQAMRSEGRYGKWKDDIGEEIVIGLFGGFYRACEIELTPEMWQARKKEYIREYLDSARMSVQFRIEDVLKEFPSQKLLNA